MNEHWLSPSKPVRWNGECYHIIKWGKSDGKPIVELDPNNTELQSFITEQIRKCSPGSPPLYLTTAEPYTWFVADPRKGE